jgi:catechol 2,3-dioxygenase-like lactoylglutathione lyase family enzyme
VIDHLKLHVADPAASRAFYEAALEPLGYRVLLDFGPVVGMGADRPDFWLAPAEGNTAPSHVAFRADSEQVVQRFHEAALAAGGADNGAPGPRPQYHQNYYGAFALDPDGNNVEAVYHGAMQPEAGR